jgi:hypothetical protein
MAEREAVMTGGCQCGAVRYALYAMPESSVCHCRMCQKAVGGLFAALSKVKIGDFAWTQGTPGAFRSSSLGERHFCSACGTPLTFHYIDGEAIEVTLGSLDEPVRVPIVRNFCVESRIPWIDRLMPGAMPEARPSRTGLTSFQGPDGEPREG